jgi:hypothetical protein
MRIGRPAHKIEMLRQRQAAETARKKRLETAREAIATVSGSVASIHVDKNKITLARLRFMGEEPHPSQMFTTENDMDFDFNAHLHRQRDWSEKTFGPGPRTKGIIDHIRKELAEIAADPTDLAEWLDVVTLALDGAWRAGYTPEQIIAAYAAKQDRNESRDWPDWRTANEDEAIEHVR